MTTTILNPEGSRGQSAVEQARFLGMAVRSLIETVACQQIIQRRGDLQDEGLLRRAYEDSQMLVRKLQSFRKSLSNSQHQVRQDSAAYGEDVLI